MKKQMKKLVVLLGLAGVFCLMSFNEPRWFDDIVDIKTYCGEHGFFKMLDYQLDKMAYYGYCECYGGYFGDRCEFMPE